MELELIKFIRNHSDWEERLSALPYCLTITRKEKFGKHLVMFKYSQIESDFSNEIVKEARGIILDEDSLEIVSYPFRKFMNYGEANADEIDWTSASVLEKIDGSLIKIVRIGSDFLISTNGTIDADDAPIAEQIGCPFKTFGDAVRFALGGQDLFGLFPEENVTYMFELVSPFTRVVIPYPETELYFLGCRDNVTLQETLPFDHPLFKLFKTPKVFPLKTLDDCISSVKDFPWNEEGYVVVDSKFHRIKVKSPAWIATHHLVGNGALSSTRCLELVRLNEVSEVLNYFPNLKDEIEEIKQKYLALRDASEKSWKNLNEQFEISKTPRKDLAIWITSHFQIPGIAFSLLDSKVSSVEEWLLNCSLDALAKHLGLKN